MFQMDGKQSYTLRSSVSLSLRVQLFAEGNDLPIAQLLKVASDQAIISQENFSLLILEKKRPRGRRLKEDRSKSW